MFLLLVVFTAYIYISECYRKCSLETGLCFWPNGTNSIGLPERNWIALRNDMKSDDNEIIVKFCRYEIESGIDIKWSKAIKSTSFSISNCFTLVSSNITLQLLNVQFDSFYLCLINYRQSQD